MNIDCCRLKSCAAMAGWWGLAYLFLSALNVSQNPLHLALVDDGAHHRLVLQGVADLDALGLVNELLHELFMDVAVDVHPGAIAAHLQ